MAVLFVTPVGVRPEQGPPGIRTHDVSRINREGGEGTCGLPVAMFTSSFDLPVRMKQSSLITNTSSVGYTERSAFVICDVRQFLFRCQRGLANLMV